MAALLLLLGCGDNHTAREDTFVGVSGERLKLQWYLYQDGAKQPERNAFYDVGLHGRCARAEWFDGVTRCTPIADSSVYTDPDCTIERGRQVTMRGPRYFIGHDRIDGKLVRKRLLRAGARMADTERPTMFFERRDDTCTRISEPPDTVYFYEIAAELDVNGQVEVWTEEQAVDDRLQMRMLVGAEGVASLDGFHDRALELDCRPEGLADGTTACVPSETVVAAHFADVSCEEPVVVAEESPRAVVVHDRYGCATYHTAGAEHASLLFRMDGDRCVRYTRATDERAYRIGAPLELVPFERAIENDPSRRLQRITLRAGGVSAVDDHLYDVATRSECAAVGNGELSLCMPSSTTTASRAYTTSQCVTGMVVTDLPRTQCTRSSFAVNIDELTVHTIEKPFASALWTMQDGICLPRATPVEAITHVAGPALPIDSFVNGVVFSER